MRGDFSRNTFDRRNHFSGVLMQQGRVQLDADWNEQAAIMQYYLRCLAADIIGPHGGLDDSFAITVTGDKSDDLGIHPGHYYVEGILCEIAEHETHTFGNQPDYRPADDWKWNDGNYLVYLDVWERHITYVESDNESDPGIREVALDGPDTATRAKVVWQVKVKELKDDQYIPTANASIVGSAISTAVVDDDTKWKAVTKYFWQSEYRGRLKARAKEDTKTDPTDPCTIAPEAKYRGHENQLYRVEIHRGGVAWDGTDEKQGNAATFKWSRENGSVIFPVIDVKGMPKLNVEGLNRDDRLGLNVDDWVEFVDDDSELGVTDPRDLLQVKELDATDGTVTLKSSVVDKAIDPAKYEPQEKHAFLRRWDHSAQTTSATKELAAQALSGGAIVITEYQKAEDHTKPEQQNWLNMEDGIQIQFQPSEDPTSPQTYRAGDYWLIPARTLTGDVEWPGTIEKPGTKPPDGVEHHYAPLALITVKNNKPEPPDSCRRTFKGYAARA
jgi:hypothetical protein